MLSILGKWGTVLERAGNWPQVTHQACGVLTSDGSVSPSLFCPPGPWVSGGSQWLPCPRPWQSVVREMTTCVVVAGPGRGPGDQRQRPGPDPTSLIARPVHGKPLGL